MKTLTVSRLGQKRKGWRFGNNSTIWVSVPFIRLSGNYLYKAGFKIGDMIQVEFSNDCIILKNKSPQF